jgi:hypothetical protein
MSYIFENYIPDNFVLLKEDVPKLVKLQLNAAKPTKFVMDATAKKDPVNDGLPFIQL